MNRNQNPDGRQLVCLLGIALSVAQLRADDLSHLSSSVQPFISANPTNVSPAEVPKAQDKLNLIIPRIDLFGATTERAFQTLAEESRNADPAHVGINFDLPPFFPMATIDLSLENVSVKTVLESIVQKANLQYTVVGDIVRVRPSTGGTSIADTAHAEIFLTQAYSLPTGFLQLKPDASSNDIIQALEKMGMSFQNGSTVVYQAEKRQMILTNTSEQQAQFAAILNVPAPTSQSASALIPSSPAGTLGLILHRFQVPDGILGLSPNASSTDIIRAFEARGVKFDQPSSVTYLPDNKLLAIVNTQEEVEKIGRILDEPVTASPEPAK